MAAAEPTAFGSHGNGFADLFAPGGLATADLADPLDVPQQRAPRVLRLGVEALEVGDLPVRHDHRLEDLVVVDGEVVDPGAGDGRRVGGEVRDADAGHGELPHLSLDGG